jgi:hypothetical protein
MPFEYEAAFARERDRIAVPAMPLASIRREARRAAERAHGPRARAGAFLAACGAGFAIVLSALPAAGAVG